MRSLKKRGPHVLNDLNDLLKLLTFMLILSFYIYLVSQKGIICVGTKT